MINQPQINDFYKEFYASNTALTHEGFTYSGPAIANKIQPEDRVLDVGCGRAWFKEYHPNTLGIDPVAEEADVKATIEEFQTDELFDVALCLGSVQFGELDEFKAQVDKVISLLKPTAKVFWRFKQDAPRRKFDWSTDLMQTLADEYGFDMVWYLDPNSLVEGGERIYVEWTRG